MSSNKLVPMDDNYVPHGRVLGRKNIIKAICVALGIYICSSLLFAKGLPYIQKWSVELEGENDRSWGPHHKDGRIIRCAAQEWDAQPELMSLPGLPPYTSTISFEIPVSSEHIFLFSLGSYGHGTVRTEISDDLDDKIGIEVFVHYHSIEARKRANVCHLDRKTLGQGVGIYTPRRSFRGSPPMEDKTTFDVIIRFPKSGSSKDPLVINSLETAMGAWRHDIRSLENRVLFKTLALSGSNAKINAESVSAASLRVKTDNGEITGSYNVSHFLRLKTSNAPIVVDLRMENNVDHILTFAEMTTSNALIESSIKLVSGEKSPSSTPSFLVIGKTSNGPVNISFPEALSSPFSHLSLSAQTSNGNAYTKLHPTYEGTISLKTSLVSSSIQQKSRPEDPSGEGRSRHIDIRRVMRSVLDANVWWGHDEYKGVGKGSVVVTTSNGYNTLDLS